MWLGVPGNDYLGGGTPVSLLDYGWLSKCIKDISYSLPVECRKYFLS